jgi:hypothetical protein
LLNGNKTGHIVGKDLLTEDVSELVLCAVGAGVIASGAISPLTNIPPAKENALQKKKP